MKFVKRVGSSVGRALVSPWVWFKVLTTIWIIKKLVLLLMLLTGLCWLSWMGLDAASLESLSWIYDILDLLS
jgi:predicted small integral membrane protein